jgi:hypothetical protein
MSITLETTETEEAIAHALCVSTGHLDDTRPSSDVALAYLPSTEPLNGDSAALQVLRMAAFQWGSLGLGYVAAREPVREPASATAHAREDAAQA